MSIEFKNARLLLCWFSLIGIGIGVGIGIENESDSDTDPDFDFAQTAEKNREGSSYNPVLVI